MERPLLPPAELWLAPDALRETLNRGERIEVCDAAHPRHADARPLPLQPAPPLPLAAKDQAPAQALRDFLASYPGRVLVATDSPGRREAMLEVLQAAGLQPVVVTDWNAFAFPSPAGRRWREAPDEGSEAQHTLTPTPLPKGEGLTFAIAVAPFDDGFALDAPALCVLTERQLFPERAAQPRRRKRAGREPEAIIRDLGELSLGAPIVHEDHGVGRYRGLLALEIGGMPGEFLDIEYAKGDRLYVPVAQLDRISRYSGANPDTAPLHTSAASNGRRRRKRPPRRSATSPPNCWRSRPGDRRAPGLAIDVDRAMYEPFAATFPVRGNAGPAFGDRSGDPRPRQLAADGPRGLRRRRLRQDRGRGARRLRRRQQPASRSRCWCRPPCSPNSTTATSATASPTGR